MPTADIIQLVAYVVLVVASARPMGTYLHRVYSGQHTLLSRALDPVEDRLYRACGIDSRGEMTWRVYALSLLMFSVVCVFMLYLVLRVQAWLPLNPSHASNMAPLLAINTAISFVTNTNWQAYAGETGVSQLVQMIGLTWQNFVSAAVGMSVAVAFVRGITRAGVLQIGNFWVDLTRSILYVLLPLSLVLSVLLVSQGVIMNFSKPVLAKTVDGAEQVIAQGPVASQEAIKVLGTNGGGFFNANSAHPYENPTPLSNMLESFAILLIPAGMAYMMGLFAGDRRQGWVLVVAMAVLFVIGLATIYGFERAGNPNLVRVGADATASTGSAGGNMEGKEVRLGIAQSAIFANATTAASCGAVVASHDSLTPLAGGMALLNIALGEIVFGGVGSGLYGMLLFVLITVFIAGLMVGRTPEYLGKKIGPTDMKLTMLALLALEATILLAAGALVGMKPALDARLNMGPHGLTEILYAVTSAVGNNGSAFAGLAADSPLLDLVLGVGMLVGRFLVIVPVLGVAGSMARKKVAPPSSGTFPTNGGLFVGLLVGVVLIVGALTFFPVYALGPIVDQLLMHSGTLF
jgi:K+-transporting ATPase ATPase A chain